MLKSRACASHISGEAESADVACIINFRLQMAEEVTPRDGDAAAAAPAATTSFTFEAAPAEVLPSLSDKHERWLKWDLNTPRRVVASYRFGRRFDASEAGAFLTDFFNSGLVCLASRTGAPVRIPAGSVTGVDFTPLRATVLGMDFFDGPVLQNTAICSPSGAIKKCMEDMIEDLPVSDELRDALINPDSAHVSSKAWFSETASNELIFRLFKHFVIGGGGLCQVEDDVHPYLTATREVYRDLLTVVKGSDGGIKIASHVFAVTGLRGSGDCPRLWGPGLDDRYSVAWVIVDPVRRAVRWYYAGWTSIW